MQISSGILQKMQVRLATPIEYTIPLSDARVELTPNIGKEISLTFTGNIYCIQCGRKITKSFQQGFCYPCYQRLLSCNLCIIHPERCLVEKGKCPQDDWAHTQCHQSHVIYLANTSGLKVGVTRNSQIPTRWIDQGAVQALAIIQVSNRYRAGRIELGLKKFFNDKTNWRKMLKNEVDLIDLNKKRSELIQSFEKTIYDSAKAFKEDIKFLSEEQVTLEYPVNQYPQKINSLSFDKTPKIKSKLQGIKGQYLILDAGVINLRKFGGYELEVLF